MKTTIELLDELKMALGFTSDYQLAKYLKISTARIGNYRSGRSTIDDLLAIRVAEELKYDPGLVLTWIHAERAIRLEHGDVAKLLEAFAKKAMRRAAVILLILGCGALLEPSPAQAAAPSVYYVKWLRRRLAAARSAVRMMAFWPVAPLPA